MAAFSQHVLHLFFVLAFYAGIVDVRLNNYSQILIDFARIREIPGIPGFQATGYTGHWLLDTMHNVAALVFWDLGQGGVSGLLLQAIAIIGAGATSLFLLILEVGRTESLSRVITKVLMFMFIGHYGGTATILPLLCVRELRSHSEMSARRDSRPDNLTILRTLKFCVPGIYLLFSSVVFLPAPSVVSYSSKHFLLVLYSWWGIPISVALALSCFLQKDKTASAARRNLPSAVASTLRSSYPIAFACAVISYWGVILTALATTWSPFGILSSYKGETSIGRMLPQPLWSLPRVTSLAEGMTRVISWDFPIICATILTWAVVRYTRACKVEKIPVDYPKFLLQVLGLSVAVGPHGAAAILLWRRNEMFEQALEREKEK